MRWQRVLNVVGVHADGVRGDVVVGGLGDVPGETVFDKHLYFKENLDDLRRLLLHEPRGCVSRPVNFIVPATHPEAAFGYIITLPDEYPVMSGSNTICVATVLLETGMFPMTEPITELALEAPAGLIRVRAECSNGKVTRVSFLNQPAFVYHLGANVEVAGHGTITVDAAFGGMTYALVDAASMGFGLTPDEAQDLCRVGERVKSAAAEQLETVHPLEPRYPGLTQTEFTGPLLVEDGVVKSRNAVVVTPGFIDRCPCGAGTSARLAVMHYRGQIEVGQPFVHESLIGSKFHCAIEETTTVGPYSAVWPRIGGQAWLTSMSQVGLDPTDPFPSGFTLGDTWFGMGTQLDLEPVGTPVGTVQTRAVG